MVAHKSQLTEADARELLRLRKAPVFIKRAYVEDHQNKLTHLGQFWPEQQAWISALISYKQVLGLKPRQLGFTTLTTLFFAWKAFMATEPIKFAQIVHEDQAMLRIAKMLRTAIDQLPPAIRPRYRTNNIETTVLELKDKYGNLIDGPHFTRILAGGKGQGRSWSYNNIHATEMAHWAKATSAVSDEGELSADEEVFNSLLNTKHDPNGHVVVESTGNGPSGLFFKLYERAHKKKSGWTFVFVPWTSVSRYSFDLSDRQALALEADLTDIEKRLVSVYKVTLGQIAWRRWKKDDAEMSDLDFRRAFPITSDEPFLLDENAFFDLEALQVQMRYAENAGVYIFPDGELEVFAAYEPDRLYVLGGDPSGGTKNDEAVYHVFRDDLVHAAMWTSDSADSGAQALEVSRLGGMYGCPLAVIESNKFGAKVIELLSEMGGVRLWKSPEGTDFWADHNSVRMVFIHARAIVAEMACLIQDVETIKQLRQIIVRDGKIKARSGHDDRAFAFVYAMWAWLSLNLEKPKELDDDRTRILRILQRFNVRPHAVRG